MKYEVKKNAKYNSVEIKFDAKPDENVRNVLKQHSFRWNRKTQLWYGYMEEADVRKMLGDEVNADPVPSKAKPKQVFLPEEESKEVNYWVSKSDGTYEERTGTFDAVSGCVMERRGKDWIATDFQSGNGVCRAPSKAELLKKLSELKPRLDAFRKTEQYAELVKKLASKAA